MTEPTTTAGEVGGELTCAAEPPPFLRITGTYPGTYPVERGRVETVQLEMHLVEGQVVDDDDVTNSWFTDFCTCVIAALRRDRPAGGPIVSTGPALAARPADETGGA